VRHQVGDPRGRVEEDASRGGGGFLGRIEKDPSILRPETITEASMRLGGGTTSRRCSGGHRDLKSWAGGCDADRPSSYEPVLGKRGPENEKKTAGRRQSRHG